MSNKDGDYMKRLDGKVAVITGSGTGIGKSIALRFAQEGADIVLNGRRTEPIDTAADEIKKIGHKVVAVAGRVTDGKGHPRHGIEVRARQGGHEARGRTDTDGYYRISRLGFAPGPCTVIVAGRERRVEMAATNAVTGIDFVAESYGTDCYPNKYFKKKMRLKDFPYAMLMNPRNAYQNYNVGVNLGEKTIYTYMGVIRPNLQNANYSSAGVLSPLFNDPYFKTIGLGTRIFLGGGEGYVIWYGTQHNPKPARGKKANSRKMNSGKRITGRRTGGLPTKSRMSTPT